MCPGGGNKIVLRRGWFSYRWRGQSPPEWKGSPGSPRQALGTSSSGSFSGSLVLLGHYVLQNFFPGLLKDPSGPWVMNVASGRPSRSENRGLRGKKSTFRPNFAVLSFSLICSWARRVVGWEKRAMSPHGYDFSRSATKRCDASDGGEMGREGKGSKRAGEQAGWED